MNKRLFGQIALRALVAGALTLTSLVGWTEELHVASSGGFAAAYSALAPDFEQKTGHKLTIAWGPSMGHTPNTIPSRLERGEPLDVVIMVGSALDDLLKTGQVQPQGHTVLARSLIGMMVKSGNAKPDISTTEKLKSVLLNAKSVVYSDSASGVYLSTVLFKRLGIAEQLQKTGRMIPAEPVAKVVARGEADIGFQQVSEILPIPGVDLVSIIPADAQLVTLYSAGIVAKSQHKAAAQEFIDYLSSPAAAQIIRNTGLEPATKN